MWHVALALNGLDVCWLCASQSTLPTLISMLDPVGSLSRFLFLPCLYCANSNINRFLFIYLFILKRKKTICSGEERTFLCCLNEELKKKPIRLKYFGCLHAAPQNGSQMFPNLLTWSHFSRRATTPHHTVFIGQMSQIAGAKSKLLYLSTWPEMLFQPETGRAGDSLHKEITLWCVAVSVLAQQLCVHIQAQHSPGVFLFPPGQLMNKQKGPSYLNIWQTCLCRLLSTSEPTAKFTFCS